MMNQVVIKERYSATELAAMALDGLPSTKVGVRSRAEREAWPFVTSKGTGGTRREYLPPKSVVESIRAKAARNLVAAAPKLLPATGHHHQVSQDLTAKQMLVADARKGILTAIHSMMERSGYSIKAAARTLLQMAERNDVPPHVLNMLRLARDNRGRQSLTGLPSVSSLLRLVEYERAGTLAPRYQVKDMSVPAWAPLFMQCYQRPEKPTVNHAYDAFCALAPEQGFNALPSIWQVRRFLDKVGNVSREMGRMGERELKTLRPFVRRSFKHLLPTDIYSADGHAFDAEVQHPIHGRPFRPEITSVVDIATRRLVGWSVGLSESAFAVVDALRAACMQAGIPAIFYVDNGAGYRNQLMNDVATGLMGRLGIEMHHSLPYNSQARGVIERLHQTVWVRAAKEVPGYMGRDMDRQAAQVIHKLSRKAIKSKATGEAMTMPLMGWSAFVEFCKVKVAEYNDRPHSSLPKIANPINGRQRHMSPNEAWQVAVNNGFTERLVADDDARPLFRPQELRTIQRGEIALFGNRYFSHALEEFNGDQMRIAYDIHDAARVWVYDADGRFVCTAEHNGNEHEYKKTSVMDRARNNRADGRERNVLRKLDDIRLERDGIPALEQVNSIHIPGLFKVDRAELAQRAQDITLVASPVQAQAEEVKFQEVPRTLEWEVPKEPLARYNEWQRISTMEEGELTERQKKWRQSYMTTSDFRVFSKKTA